MEKSLFSADELMPCLKTRPQILDCAGIFAAVDKAREKTKNYALYGYPYGFWTKLQKERKNDERITKHL